MTAELDVLQDATAKLERAGIPHMITGPMAIVSREDLILSKLAWAKDSGSEMQMRDVQALLAVGADRTYLERWARELSVADLPRRSLDKGHDT